MTASHEDAAKGMPARKCNRTRCGATETAYDNWWWNWSTRAWYCQKCALAINEVGDKCCIIESSLPPSRTDLAPPEQAPEVAEYTVVPKGDGSVFLKYPDGSHRGIYIAEAAFINRALKLAASHPTVPPSGDKKKALDKKTSEYLKEILEGDVYHDGDLVFREHNNKDVTDEYHQIIALLGGKEGA